MGCVILQDLSLVCTLGLAWLDMGMQGLHHAAAPKARPAFTEAVTVVLWLPERG